MSFKKFFLLILIIATFLSPLSFAKKFELVDWQVPVPKFSELGLDIHRVAKVAGDGQLIIARPGVTMNLWSKGKVREYKNARFQSSAIVFDRPVEEVRAFIQDPVKMESGMPQVTDSEILETRGKHSMVYFLQTFKLPLISLKSKFLTQWTKMDDGSFAVLLHDGDVDAAVSYWEFYPLDEKRSLVVLTNWVDLDSAGLAFKIVLAAQPDLKPTIPAIASAMYLQQVKDGMNGVSSDAEPTDISALPYQVKIPTVNSSQDRVKTVKELIKFGTVIKVHPIQWTQEDGEAKKHWFITSSALVEAPLVPVKKYAQELTRVDEYFKQTRKVTYKPDVSGFDFTWNMKFNLGPIFVPVVADVRGNYVENTDKNVVLINRVGGSLDPLNGAFEWLPVDEDNTIISFTLGNHIGDEASWILRMLRNMPVVDMITSVFFTMALIEKQQAWIPEQITKDTATASTAK